MGKYYLIYHSLKWIIAGVWLINGLYCKILGLVPRHELIVSEILDSEYSRLLTILIGMAEIIMAIWILSGYKSRLNTILQMIVVTIMNVLEFFLVPSLLLWGRLNIVFAMCFVLLLYFHQFKLKPGNDV
ncbi:MAG: DoxX-like family protein [Bacteroidota bacterium]